MAADGSVYCLHLIVGCKRKKDKHGILWQLSGIFRCHPFTTADLFMAADRLLFDWNLMWNRTMIDTLWPSSRWTVPGRSGRMGWSDGGTVSLLPCWLWGLIAAWDRGHMFHESIDFGWGTWAARHWPPWAESAGRSTTRADGLHLHPALSRDKDQPSLKYNLRFFYDFSLFLDFQVYRSSSPLAAGLEPSRLHVYFQLNLKLLCVSRAVPWYDTIF